MYIYISQEFLHMSLCTFFWVSMSQKGHIEENVLGKRNKDTPLFHLYGELEKPMVYRYVPFDPSNKHNNASFSLSLRSYR